MPDRFEPVAEILRGAVEAHAFPAACIEVGGHDGARWNAAFGGLTFDPYAPPATPDTIYDLASLTKVIATTTLAMRAIESGRMTLDEPLSGRLASWRGADRSQVTIRHLLTHSSGLSAYLPFYRDYTGRPEFEHAICQLPLEYAPDAQSIYSDLGFMLVGFILEDVALGPLQPPRSPAAFDPSCGEVHDENCWALGGAAGHAGLFGTAGAVGAFARAVLRTINGEPILAKPETMRTFISRGSVPHSSRALGWDTMLPSSSCGTKMSRTAIGHTGFTGTSLWIDWERDLYVVLLTNRVHPTRQNEAIRSIRPLVHDTVVELSAS
jgi:CubicO group peptidase (beta-lactamase class C family)